MKDTERDFSVAIGNKVLEHPIMNGAGICKGELHFKELADSASSALVFGSVTKEAREFNPGETYFRADNYAANSLGMPNKGLEFYADNLQALMYYQLNIKPLILNVAGFSIDEYFELCMMGQLADVDIIELNCGCPNVWTEDGQKPILSYQPKLMQELLEEVGRAIRVDIPILVKLSPIFDAVLMGEMASVLNDYMGAYKVLTGIVTSNTLPNTVALNDKHKPALNKMIFGGMSGPALKPVALGQVMQFRKLLPPDAVIIGVGGITTGQDVADYLNYGANAVQITTAFFDEGAYVFERILREYTEVLEQEGEENETAS